MDPCEPKVPLELLAVPGTEDAEGCVLFGAVAERVYAHDAVWAPASETAWRLRMYQLAGAEGVSFQGLVAIEGGEPVGRCMPILVPGSTDASGRPQGWIAFFECEGHRPEAARALLAAGESFLRARGACSVQVSRADNQLAGILVDGFEFPHLVWTNHNPPHYLDLLRSCGYQDGIRMVSYRFYRDRAPEFRLVLPGLKVREFDRSDLDREVQIFHRLQRRIFGKRPGYVPRSLSEDRSYVEGLLRFIRDDLVIIAESEAGDPVGLLVCVPDFYQGMRGDPIDRARIVTIGADPAYAARGIGALMGARLMENLIEHTRISYVEGSWVRGDNLGPGLLARRFNALKGREFRLPEKRLV